MAFVVLITWFAAVLAGLYMLAVWLIENDITGSGVTASRLPATVVFGHLALAVCGLGLWVTYLVLGQKRFAWAAIGVLAGIALLGFTMFARWIPVYREPDPPAAPGQLSLAGHAGPAESNFPVAVVAAHGLLAVTTLVLAILSAISSSAILSVRAPLARARRRPGHVPPRPPSICSQQQGPTPREAALAFLHNARTQIGVNMLGRSGNPLGAGALTALGVARTIPGSATQTTP